MDKTIPSKTKKCQPAVALRPKTSPPTAETETSSDDADMAITSEQPATPVEVSSPGRLCLFGEHSDWGAEYGLHQGYCLVVGTDQCIKAVVTPSEEFRVQSLIPDDMGRPSGRIRQMSCPWDSEALLAAATDEEEFFRYCAGVAYEMLRREHLPHGLDIKIVEMELPLKKGVSSSAAVCILVAKAFNQCFGLRMLPHELMDVSYAGERLTGSQCGRMDQACIYGSTPVLLVFNRSKDVRIEPVFPRDDIFLFYVDLAGKKNTVTILRDLQNSYLKHKTLQEALGAGNENLVRQAFQAIQDGRAQELGMLMVTAQKAFDQHVAIHCPDELGAPLLHEVLTHPAIAPHVYGGKGVGSQGDGTAQFVARSAADREQAMNKIVAAFPQMRCFPLTIRGTGTR
jgi:galactokinase